MLLPCYWLASESSQQSCLLRIKLHRQQSHVRHEGQLRISIAITDQHHAISQRHNGLTTQSRADASPTRPTRTRRPGASKTGIRTSISNPENQLLLIIQQSIQSNTTIPHSLPNPFHHQNQPIINNGFLQDPHHRLRGRPCIRRSPVRRF